MPKAASSELQDFLFDLARKAAPGDRLPAIRELMRRFKVSQTVVQRVLDELKSRSLITSEVGRGTYFLGGDTSDLAAPAKARSPSPDRVETGGAKSVLLLRRSYSVSRGRILADLLQQRFVADGHRVLEVSYTDPGHAMLVLKGLPRFDACVIQSTFMSIPIGLLSDLRARCDVIAVDGAALSGADVEVVGMEWGEPLEEALATLRQLGHRRIAVAITAHPFMAGQLGLRRLEHLRRRMPELELHSLTVSGLPNEEYEASLVRAVSDQMAHQPVTAVVAWGVDDGRRLASLLARAELEVPAQLSMVLLGRTDLSNEHADFFHTVGCRVADQVDALHAVIEARWADPAAPHAIKLIPVSVREGASVGAVARPAQASVAPRKRVRDGSPSHS